MLRRRLRAPSPAFAISIVALFVALGGTSLAAATLINGKNIQKHTIAKDRLTNKAIKQLKGNRGPRGPQGIQGTQGIQGVQGVQGTQGVQGPAGPITGNLPAGVTLRGQWGAEGDAAGATSYRGSTVSFNLKLASAPTITFVASGATPPAQCPGTLADPEATAGNLCIFEGSNKSNNQTPIFFLPNAGTGLYGFSFQVFAVAAGNYWDYGTWAVTAPTGGPASHQAKPQGLAGTSSAR